MKSVNPYLNFSGNTEEAFNFYRSVFGGEFVTLVRFKDFGEGHVPVPENEEKIAHIALPLGESNVLMATDTRESEGRTLTAGNNFHLAVEADSAQEAERVFSGLSAGGRTDMPLMATEWAEKYGICADRFGVQWMVSYTGETKFTGGSAA